MANNGIWRFGAQVKFANKKGLPFLTTNSAHGAITTLGKMKSGILVDLDELTGVEIAVDGQTVTVAGGTKSHFLSKSLWDAGKQAGKYPSSYTYLGI